jgi:hypothetical protein
MNKTHFADDETLAHIAALERDLSAAQERIERLEGALRLPFEWEATFDNKGAEASDEFLKKRGWDEQCSPEEFMREFQSAAIKEKS